MACETEQANLTAAQANKAAAAMALLQATAAKNMSDQNYQQALTNYNTASLVEAGASAALTACMARQAPAPASPRGRRKKGGARE